MTPQEAWDIGRDDLRAGQMLGGPGRAGCWFLPYAVMRARSGGAGAPWALTPGWASLTGAERRAAAILWTTLAHDGGYIGDVMEAHPSVMAEIYCLYAETRVMMRDQKAYRFAALGPTPPEDRGNPLQNPYHAAIQIVQDSVARQGQAPVPPGFRKSVTDPDFPDFLAAHPDPDLWHLIAADFNWDLAPMPGLLTWIVQQDDCDAGTAALILMNTRCTGIIGRRRDRLADYAALAADICLRAQGRGFQRRKLAVDAAAAERFLRMLASGAHWGYVLLERGVPPGLRALLKRHVLPELVPMPSRLFDEPFGRGSPVSPYLIEDEGTIRAA